MSVEMVVCFDLGGVLVRICRGWEEACERAGLPVRDAARFGVESVRPQRREVLDRYQCGLVDTPAFYAELSRVLFDVYSPAEVERIFDAWSLDEYPGAQEFVQRLNGVPGLVTACLSNTNAAHWRRLANLDGRREYPAVTELMRPLASHLLQLLKPDPAIYAHAQAAFAEGTLAPEQVIFFDDLPENVEAALAHGWHATRIDPSGDPVRQMRDVLSRLGVRTA